MRNLVTRLHRRESVLLYGGPKLGKTSLLLHVKWLLEQQGVPSSDGLTVQYGDLVEAQVRERFLAGDLQRSSILLLDNCDHLLQHGLTTGKALARGNGDGGPRQPMVWAGGRAWREYIRSGRSGLTLAPVPLAILLNGEARSLVTPELTTDQADAILSYGGTHPYVLKMLRARMIADPTADPAHLVSAVQVRLAPFFLACLEAVREPVERTLLNYLIRHQGPINPRQAAQALGLPTVKPAADTLCYLGVISRWNLNEGAMLHASCRLFNDWYGAHTGHPR
ncbi:MAG: hypothetical protein ACREIO_09265 [Nitrospiraceae bacterium]